MGRQGLTWWRAKDAFPTSGGMVFAIAGLVLCVVEVAPWGAIAAVLGAVWFAANETPARNAVGTAEA